MVPVLAALTMLGFGIYGMPVALNEIKTGAVYSLAVIFGDGTQVHKDSSPIAFWMNTGLHILAFVMMIILGVGMLCGVVIDQKRKISEKKRKGRAATKEDSKENDSKR